MTKEIISIFTSYLNATIPPSFIEVSDDTVREGLFNVV